MVKWGGDFEQDTLGQVRRRDKEKDRVLTIISVLGVVVFCGTFGWAIGRLLA